MRILLINIFVLFAIVVFANHEVDSLLLVAESQLEINADSACELALSVLDKNNNQQNTVYKARALMVLGKCSWDRFNFTQSHDYYVQAKEVYVSINDKSGEMKAKRSLAALLIDYSPYVIENQENYFNRAHKLLDECTKYFLKKDEKQELIKCYISKGNLLRKKHETEPSSTFYRKAFAIGLEINDSASISTAAQNISSNFQFSKQWDSVLTWSEVTYQYACDQCHEQIIMQYSNKGVAHFMLANDSMALLNYSKAEDYARANDIRKSLLEIYSNLAFYHHFKGNYRESADYFYKYSDLSDSITAINKLKLFTAAQEQYHTQELKAEAERASHIKKISILIGGASALVALTTFLFFQQRRRAINRKMKLEKQLFAQQIEQQENKSLQAILDALDDERNRVSKDLHDRIGAGISTAKLYFEGMQKMIKGENADMKDSFERVDVMLTSSIDEVRKVSRNLASGVLADFGLLPAIFDLKETINKSGTLELSLKQNIDDIRFMRNVEINTYRVIQELVSNTIKHAHAKKIIINLDSQKDTLVVHYSDDGDGYNPNTIKEGLGLSNILSRVATMNGEFINKSKVKQGTVYEINIPLVNPN